MVVQTGGGAVIPITSMRCEFKCNAQPLVLKEWNERLWVALVDRATVCSDGRIVFRFKSGSEIAVEV